MNSALGHADPTVANRTEREWEILDALEYTRWIWIFTDTPTTRLQCLDQTIWWSAREGWIKIEEMEPSHRQNTANFLLRHADNLYFRWLLRYTPSSYGDDRSDLFDADDLTPEAWMKTTPLYKALTNIEGE